MSNCTVVPLCSRISFQRGDSYPCQSSPSSQHFTHPTPTAPAMSNDDDLQCSGGYMSEGPSTKTDLQTFKNVPFLWLPSRDKCVSDQENEPRWTITCIQCIVNAVLSCLKDWCDLIKASRTGPIEKQRRAFTIFSPLPSPNSLLYNEKIVIASSLTKAILLALGSAAKIPWGRWTRK